MTKAKAITNNITQNINIQKKILRILIIIGIILSVLYAYMIGSMTFNITARRSFENTLTELNTSVNKLELTYLNDVNKIDKDYALSVGFVDVHQNIFASRSINHVAIR